MDMVRQNSEYEHRSNHDVITARLSNAGLKPLSRGKSRAGAAAILGIIAATYFILFRFF